MYSLEQKYSAFIDRVPMNADSRDKFAQIIAGCAKEYQVNAKGFNNLEPVKELLRKLFLRIFLRFKEIYV